MILNGRVHISAKSYTIWAALEMTTEYGGRVLKRPYFFGWTRLTKRACQAFRTEGRGY